MSAHTFLERVAAQVEAALRSLREVAAAGQPVALTIEQTSRLQTALSSVCTVLNEQFIAIPSPHGRAAGELRAALREHARIRYTSLTVGNATRIATLLADALPVIGATIDAERAAHAGAGDA